MCRDPGESGECSLGELSIGFVVSESVETEKSNSGGGIARRRGRVLQRFATGGQGAEAQTVAAFVRIAEAIDHRLGDFFREMEVAEVRAGFIRVKTGYGGEGVIIQYARNA